MKNYRETFEFPDGSKAYAFGDEHMVQVNYIGKDKIFAEKFTMAIRKYLEKAHDKFSK